MFSPLILRIQAAGVTVKIRLLSQHGQILQQLTPEMTFTILKYKPIASV